jgi:hypothetical protein
VPDTVDATVANGWLTLSGRVKHQYESNAAFEAVPAAARAPAYRMAHDRVRHAP